MTAVDRCFGYSAVLDIQNGGVTQPAVLVMKTLNHDKNGELSSRR
jgi:hypothetical protein